jgi:hypothetical protein
MDLFDLGRLSPAHWFASATEPIQHPAYAVLAGLLVLGLVAAIYLRITSEHMFDGHRFKQRQVARGATAVIWVCAAGLLVLLFRWQPVPMLSMRVWFYLWWIGAAVLVAYGVYFYRRVYPERLSAYEDAERRRRYLPRPSSAARPRQKARRRR